MSRLTIAADTGRCDGTGTKTYGQMVVERERYLSTGKGPPRFDSKCPGCPACRKETP